eukprot:g974.t1
MPPPPPLPPRGGPPKVGPPKVGPPKVGPPKVGPPKVGPPKVGPPKVGPPKVGPPKVGPPKVGPPKAGPPRPGLPRPRGPPKVGPPKARGPPKVGPPKVGAPKAGGPPKIGAPKAGGPPKIGAPKAGGPPKIGAPKAGGPPKIGAPKAGGPPKIGAPKAGGPPKIGAPKAGGPPKMGGAPKAGGPPKMGGAPQAGGPPKMGGAKPAAPQAKAPASVPLPSYMDAPLASNTAPILTTPGQTPRPAVAMPTGSLSPAQSNREMAEAVERLAQMLQQEDAPASEPATADVINKISEQISRMMDDDDDFRNGGEFGYDYDDADTDFASEYSDSDYYDENMRRVPRNDVMMVERVPHTELPHYPTPYELWKRAHEVAEEPRPPPVLTEAEWDKLIEKLNDQSKKKQIVRMRQQHKHIAKQLAGLNFKPHINKLSREMAAENLKLYEGDRLKHVVKTKQERIEKARHQLAQDAVAECTFSPDLTKKARQFERNVDDLMQYAVTKRMRMMQRRQIQQDLEDRDLTFRPHINRKSTAIVQRMQKQGKLLPTGGRRGYSGTRKDPGHAEETFSPKINKRSGSLRQSGNVYDRLYKQAKKQNMQHQRAQREHIQKHLKGEGVTKLVSPMKDGMSGNRRSGDTLAIPPPPPPTKHISSSSRGVPFRVSPEPIPEDKPTHAAETGGAMAASFEASQMISLLANIENLEEVMGLISESLASIVRVKRCIILPALDEGRSLLHVTQKGAVETNQKRRNGIMHKRATTYGGKINAKTQRNVFAARVAGLVGTVSEKRERIIANNAQSHENFSTAFSIFLLGQQQGSAVKNIAVEPLIDASTGLLAGVAFLHDKLDGTDFVESDISSIKEYLDQCALILLKAMHFDKLAMSQRKAHLAQELTNALGRELRSPEAVAEASDKFRRFLQADAVWVYLLKRHTTDPDAPKELVRQLSLEEQKKRSEKGEDKDDIVTVASSSANANREKGPRRRVSIQIQSIIADVVSTKQAANLIDAKQDPRCFHEVDLFLGISDATREAVNRADTAINLLCVPILDREDNTIGVIEVLRQQVSGGQVLASMAFGTDDFNHVVSFANQVSVALEAASLEKQKIVYMRKVEVLFKVTKVVKDDKDIGSVLSKLLVLAQELLLADRVQVLLLDEFRNTLQCEVSKEAGDDASPVRPGIASGREIAIASHVLRNMKSGATIDNCGSFLPEHGIELSSSDAAALGDNDNDRPKAITGICVPILTARGRPLGILQAFNTHAKLFHAADLELLEAFCHELRGAIARISLESTLKETMSVEKTDEQVKSMLQQYTSADDRNHSTSKNDEGQGYATPRSQSLSMTPPLVNAKGDTGIVSEAELTSFAFDPFEHSRESLCNIYVHMFSICGLIDRFKMDRNVVQKFAGKVMEHYYDNPYHNFYHAFSVAQFCFASYSINTKIAETLRSTELLAMLVASLVHDAEHPGSNNAWEINTRSDLAILYNDISVLENHHASVGFRIMWSNENSNVFGELKNPAEEKVVRKTYVDAILQTDMSHHFKMVQDLTKLDNASPFDRESLDDRRYLTGVLVHAADISNPLIPDFELCKNWAVRIMKEFASQYAAEVEKGLPPTKMWSNAHTELGLYQSQVNFITFIVGPMWTVILELFPEFNTKAQLVDALNNNKAQWSKLVEETKAKEIEGEQDK